MENLNDIYHRAFEVWKYDQLEPEEKLFVGRKPPREVPLWAMKVPAHLKSREQLSEWEQEKREDEFLKKHGIV